MGVCALGEMVLDSMPATFHKPVMGTLYDAATCQFIAIALLVGWVERSPVPVAAAMFYRVG